MKITLIRNATLLVEYAGNRFLVDPAFGKKGSRDPFPCNSHPDLRNPVVELPMTVKEILKATDAVIITHLHSDHFDDEAAEAIPKDMDIFVQNAEDKEKLETMGFKNVLSLETPETYYGIEIFKTPGRHGWDGISKEALEDLGSVCGVVLKKNGEETLYIAGDTVWYEGVCDTLTKFNPEVIVVNAGANELAGDRLVMDEEDVKKVHETCPEATIVAVHMEAFNHWTLSRKELWNYSRACGFNNKLLIPADGESFTLR